MKQIYIEDWTKLKYDCDNSEHVPTVKVREGGIIKVSITEIISSCDLSYYESLYLKEGEIRFGAAASAIDRCLQLAVSSLKEKEKSRINVTLKGEYIHERLKAEIVNFNCDMTYNILVNGKEMWEYNGEDRLGIGRKYKDVALQRLKSDSSSCKFAIQLSVFILLARALKWLTLIHADDLSEQSRKELVIIKSQCYNNLSHFHLAFKNYEKAVAASSVVLNLDSSNIKALYRRGVGNLNLQNYELAQKDFETVLSFDSSNAAAKKQFSIIVEKKKSLDCKYAQAMKKFLSI